MRKSISQLALLTFLTFSIVAVFGSTASAAKPVPPSTLGNDISWPQCGRRLPVGQAFGIVGVNDGLANTTNPCFAEQLAWAQQSVGGTGQPNVALYVNTANPGHAGLWWPSSNVYEGTTVTSKYGTCTGLEDAACAYVYGYAKAYDDVVSRGVPNPTSYLWWLDVEQTNSWSATDKVANAADLEGMVAYFQSQGIKVGLYSTNYQWSVIAGTVTIDSNLNNLRSWIAGASSESNAKSMCTSQKPLTSGSPVQIVQFVSKNLDYDYSCI